MREAWAPHYLSEENAMKQTMYVGGRGTKLHARPRCSGMGRYWRTQAVKVDVSKFSERELCSRCR